LVPQNSDMTVPIASRLQNGATFMSPELRIEIRREADLIARFAESYRRRFSELIDQMNHPHPSVSRIGGVETSAEAISLRLCVEAVDMMLATQQQLARAIDAISADLGIRKAA
jgi:hypothetical protein